MMNRQVLSRGVAMVFVLLAAGACHEPTQVELHLSTDLPCDRVHGTAVTVGRRGELELAFPAASLEVCEPGPDGRRNLGLVVLVPRDGTSDDAIALKVVAALTVRSVDDCVPSKEGARDYPGCVVARRELHYQPGQTLRLAVPLLRQCEGVECTVDSTCFDARMCMPAEVTCRQGTCTIDDAPERRFPNPKGWGTAGEGGSSGNAGGSGGGGNPAGAGGEAGSGGEAGAGGPAGASGEAGAGGLAGAGGAEGGSGGTVGASGVGGAGGIAGAGGGTSGAAGASGAGGDDGTDGGGTPLVSHVATGSSHSCAIVANGEVRCWGGNTSGQLGDGTTTNRPTPVPVLLSPGGPPLTGVQALALGDKHSCALLNGGEVHCWGDNDDGQLGDGTRTDRLSPVAVRLAPEGLPLTDVKHLALGGFHSCVLLASGEAHCWGENYYGELGDGTKGNDQLSPVVVRQSPGGAPLTGVRALALGVYNSCALLMTGEARCWGENGDGQLGNDTEEDQASPVPVLEASGGLPLTGVQSLALGDSHTCASLTNGEVRCWGYNGSGQLGGGTLFENYPTPVVVQQAPEGPPLNGVQSVELGFDHSCALRSGGEVHCWGDNDFVQLGDGTTTDQPYPVPVLQSAGGPPLTGGQALALGAMHSCALLSGGEVRCWGYNGSGQLGDGTTTDWATPGPLRFEAGAVSPSRVRFSARPVSPEPRTLWLLSL